MYYIIKLISWFFSIFVSYIIWKSRISSCIICRDKITWKFRNKRFISLKKNWAFWEGSTLGGDSWSLTTSFPSLMLVGPVCGQKYLDQDWSPQYLNMAKQPTQNSEVPLEREHEWKSKLSETKWKHCLVS
jgi:hypothetical protein